MALPFSWAATGNVLGGMVGFAAYVSLLLGHELGHAVVARVNRLSVFSIQAFWLHGLCMHEPARSRAAEIALAWGGVAAQFVLLLVALLLAKGTALVTGGIPLILQPLFFIWIPLNLLIIFHNLLPIPPLDGARAWAVLPLIWRRATAGKPAARLPRRCVVREPAGKVVSLRQKRAFRKSE